MKPLSTYSKPSKADVVDGHIFKACNFRGEPLSATYQGKRALVFFECHLEDANLPSDAVVVNCIGKTNKNPEAQVIKDFLQTECRRQQDEVLKKAKDKKEGKL